MLKTEIKEKNDKLIAIGEELKKKFIGIDDVIDQFISSIKVWYVMPELMTRPLIVNLWGLTGAGKTDLIRTFVKLSGMSRFFMEMQMDMENNKSVKNMMEFSDIDPEVPYILLLDEFQRFKTKKEDGTDLGKGSLQDIWMLLSDGKFQSSSAAKRELLDLFLMDLYYSHNEEIPGNEADTKEEVKQKTFKYKQSAYQARRLKKILKVQDSIEDIMKWDFEKKQQIILNSLQSDDAFDGTCYSKLLIIIAGNLDDAYKMSQAVSNADVSADVFHEHSKHINIITIKNALLKRFKPEQVSRLGNNHIIYKSLNTDSYNRIIRKNITAITNNVFKLHKITIIPDESIYNTIYNNGVYPTQGVRPVLSTISTIFENYIPNFLYKAIENDINFINIKYEGDQIIGTVGNDTYSYKVNLSIDTIKKTTSPDYKTLIGVHEAGHALVYSVLFKSPPTQIAINTSSEDSSGFVGLHSTRNNKLLITDRIATYLAGQAAEEFVFGDEYKSTGSWGDISEATKLAADYIRSYGFDGYQSYIVAISNPNAHSYNTNMAETNVIIENILKEQKNKARSIINQNKKLFTDIVDTLIVNEKIEPKDFIVLLKKYGIDISFVATSGVIVSDYQQKWNSFKESE